MTTPVTVCLCVYKNISIIYIYLSSLHPLTTKDIRTYPTHPPFPVFSISLSCLLTCKKKTEQNKTKKINSYIVEDLRDGPPIANGGGVSVLFSITNDLSSSFTPG